MNYRGSYRKLLGNAKAAMMAAIEIYNKPAFRYPDECVVILLLNAWELILKAALSKNGKSIFYPKRESSLTEHCLGKTLSPRAGTCSQRMSTHWPCSETWSY